MSVNVSIKYYNVGYAVMYSEVDINGLICKSMEELAITTASLGHSVLSYIAMSIADEYLLEGEDMEFTEIELREPIMLLIAINAITSKSLPKGDNISLDVEDVIFNAFKHIDTTGSFACQ
ncbi:hypothetical protein AB4332_03745 [Vibrio breoganii]